MEFRIAPMIMAFFNLIFICAINPEINSAISLSRVSNLWEFVSIFVIIFLMSIGAFSRHSFYSKPFKVSFFLVELLSLFLLVYYIYAIKSQHLS
jgi:hypothetical protein